MIIFYCLKFETPQPGGPGSCIYPIKDLGSPVIPSGIWTELISKHVYILRQRTIQNISVTEIQLKQKNSVALSPRANYTD
jgi:hypothetical protein